MVAKSRRARRKSPRPEGARHKIFDGAKDVQAPPVLVLNPTAARGKAGRAWQRVRDELRCWRTMPTVVKTERPGHGIEIARSAAAAGSSLVIAAGGDGTAHEVVQGLMEVEASASGTAFAHLPLGTGCDLARGLGLPLNPTGILRGLRKGRELYIDVGVADMTAGADTVRRYFLNAATVGLGPAVVRRVKTSKRLQSFGKRAYSLAALKELFNARPYQVSWRTDDGASGDTLMLQLFISNGPSVAGGMRPSPNASFSNGELHIVMVGALGLMTTLNQFLRLERRRPFTHPDIHSFVCRSIDLEGPELDVETDGEIVGSLPARLWVRPGGLLVRMPA
ncbi:MAG: diacylglycerol kinase family lipid kinase [Acidobacteria bacterium]|nr:diacylglycerol kinase family lipid kinase [Acidobacteriota bacterium]